MFLTHEPFPKATAMRYPAIGTILLLSIGLALSGCSLQQRPVRAGFDAPDTPGKVPAIVDAADQDDPKTLSDLVHALSDEDPAVRLFAIQALYHRTGESFGYRYYESAEKRQVASARWNTWLAARQDAQSPATADANPMP